MAFIEAEQVSHSFVGASGTVHALDRVSLTIDEGEFVAVLGPSGCGKTTLLRALGGLVRPSHGIIRVGGQEVVRPREDASIVFQTPVLLPWRDVLTNVMLPVDVSHGRRKGRKEYLARAEQLLDLVGLSGFEHRLPRELSGGMQQRVSICRALILSPRMILMDEPFGALDAITRERMGLELLRIWSQFGTTILFITHSISEATLLSDRVAVMTTRPGRVKSTVSVDLPRPRAMSSYDDLRFSQCTAKLRALIEGAESETVRSGGGS